MLGYTTIALPQWKNETNVELRLDENESSLYASLFWIIGIICSPIGGVLSGWLGRRKIVMIASPLVICGWLIIGFAQNKIMLYCGKTICSGKNPIHNYIYTGGQYVWVKWPQEKWACDFHDDDTPLSFQLLVAEDVFFKSHNFFIMEK